MKWIRSSQGANHEGIFSLVSSKPDFQHVMYEGIINGVVILKLVGKMTPLQPSVSAKLVTKLRQVTLSHPECLEDNGKFKFSPLRADAESPDSLEATDLQLQQALVVDEKEHVEQPPPGSFFSNFCIMVFVSGSESDDEMDEASEVVNLMWYTDDQIIPGGVNTTLLLSQQVTPHRKTWVKAFEMLERFLDPYDKSAENQEIERITAGWCVQDLKTVIEMVVYYADITVFYPRKDMNERGILHLFSPLILYLSGFQISFPDR